MLAWCGIIRHRAHGVLEHLAAVHLDELRVLGEHVARERLCRAARGATEQIAERAVAPQKGRQDPAMLLGPLEYGGAGAIAEQHAGRAIGPIGDRAQLLHAHDERRLGVAGGHHGLRNRGAVDESRAGGADVERGGARRAERGLQVDRRRREQSIGRRGAKDDDVQLTRVHARFLHGGARGA
jgi:hypothetical protein